MKFCKRCGQFFSEDTLDVCPNDGATLKDIRTGSGNGEDDPLIGQLVDGRFEITRLLGRGGFGAVYEAVQTSVGRSVAIKFVHDNAPADLVQRFMQEARATSQLRSPHTVTLYDFGANDDGRLFLAMELLTGDELSDRLARLGRMPWPTALRIIEQACRSLAEAHALGIVHRDLKPANIFLTKIGTDDSVVKVLDFGIAKLQSVLTSELTKSGAAMGTPAYMAPEQCRAAPVDGRADLYSLGVVLFELLTGQRPFQGPNAMAVMMAHCRDPHPRLVDSAPDLAVPPGVEDLVDALLAKSADQRPATADAVGGWCRRLLRSAGADQSTQELAAPGQGAGGRSLSGGLGTDDTLAPEAVAGPSTSSQTYPAQRTGEPRLTSTGSDGGPDQGPLEALATGAAPSTGHEAAPLSRSAATGAASGGGGRRGALLAAAVLLVSLGGGLAVALSGGASSDAAPTDPVAVTTPDAALSGEATKRAPAVGLEAPPAPGAAATATETEPEPELAAAPEAAEPGLDQAPQAAEPEPEPDVAEPELDQAPEPEPEPAPPLVTLSTQPAGATVRVDGARLVGVTPVDIVVMDTDRTVEFELPGHRKAKVVLPAGAQTLDAVTLKKRRKASSGFKGGVLR